MNIVGSAPRAPLSSLSGLWAKPSPAQIQTQNDAHKIAARKKNKAAATASSSSCSDPPATPHELAAPVPSGRKLYRIPEGKKLVIKPTLSVPPASTTAEADVVPMQMDDDAPTTQAPLLSAAVGSQDGAASRRSEAAAAPNQDSASKNEASAQSQPKIKRKSGDGDNQGGAAAAAGAASSSATAVDSVSKKPRVDFESATHSMLADSAAREFVAFSLC